METSLVYFSISELRIVSARHYLAEANIESFVINKKDSAHAGILGGTIELYVREDQQAAAHKILLETEILEK